MAFENAYSSSRVELIPSKIKGANKVVLNFHKEFLAFSSFKGKENNGYLHLIKDCDLHERRFAKNAERNGILGRRPTMKPVNPNKQNLVSACPPNPISAGQQNPVSADPPNPVFAGQPNLVSAGQPNLVSAGQPNPVFAGDGVLGPRPLNIQPKSTYFHFFTHNNQQIIFLITHNSLYSLYMTGGLNGKTAVKPSAGTGQAWMFDIDYLTDSLNYSRVSSTNLTAGSQGANPSNAGSQEDDSDLDDEPDVLIIHSTPTPVVPIVDESTTQNNGTKSDHATTNADNLDELTELQALQRQEQAGKEEADQLG
nr:hypothetical protein [Tanacetum cinerariifolium]